MSSARANATSMRENFALLLRSAAGPVAVALALAGCGGGDTAAPADANAPVAPAGASQAQAMALPQPATDPRLALPRAGALAAGSSDSATEDFEAGMARWLNWGNAQVVAGAGTSGSHALRVGPGAGGAALLVTGLVPGTTYRLTARLKVSHPTETVFAGFTMRYPSGSGASTPRSPVSSTEYVTVTVEMVVSGTSTSADVWVWKNEGTGHVYMDDVVFGPVDGTPPPPPPPPPPPSGNLISNGGFEGGMTWPNWGNARVVAGAGTSGSHALQVGTAAGGAGLEVGIVAGATYRLTAQARASDASDTVYVGINILDQAHAVIARNFVPVGSTAYGTATFSIVAPANAVRAVVYVWKDAGSGFAYVDDFVLEAADGSAPPAPPPAANLVTNGGFESGLSGWVDWGNAATSSQAAAGGAAAQVGTGAGGLGQDVGGIVAGATYRLSGLAQVSTAGETGYLGVRFTDDAGTRLLERSAAFGSTGYAAAQLELVAPANATRALVYLWKNAGSGFAYVDQVALGQVAAP